MAFPVLGSSYSRPAPRWVVYDERFEQSAAYGRTAALDGHITHAMRGDITSLWYEHLALRWSREPMPVAGMTTQQSLFCLERLAWDARLRVVLRIDHRLLSNGDVQHLVAAAPRTATVRSHLAQAGAAFGAVAARIATGWPAGPFQINAAAGLPLRHDEPEPLVTWLIASPARVA